MKKTLNHTHKQVLYNEGTVIIDNHTDLAYLHDPRWFVHKRNEDEAEVISFDELPIDIKKDYLGEHIPDDTLIKTKPKGFSFLKSFFKLVLLMGLISVSIVFLDKEFTGPQIAWFIIWVIVFIVSCLGVISWYAGHQKNSKDGRDD